MKKLLTLTIILIMTVLSSAGANSSKTAKASEPDFAYPATVTREAEAALTAALRKSDGKATVRALADMALAQSAIGNEKLPPVVKRIEELRDKEKDGVTRSLLSMLLADIYLDIYQADKWVYDHRELPAAPLPADYTEWSGKQFRSRIDLLCEEALSAADALKKAPIADYQSIIRADRLTRIFYPTLYDFAASFTIRTRKQLSPFSSCFSLIYLSPRRVFEASVITVPSSAVAANVLRTYADWLRFHEGETAPVINIDIERINTVCDGIYSTNREEAIEKKFKLLTNLYEQYRDSEYSGLALLELADSGFDRFPADGSDEGLKSLAAMLRHNIDAFPAFFRRGCLQNRLSGLTAPFCNFSFSAYVAPGNPFNINVSSRNTNKATIDFYKVTPASRSDSYYTMGKGKSKEVLVKSVTVDIPGEVPFRNDTVITTILPEEGYYVAVGRGTDVARKQTLTIIRSSRLALGAGVAGPDVTLSAIDILTGAPVSGATILRQTGKGNKANFVNEGMTDKDGFYNLTLKDRQVFALEKGSDRYAGTKNVYPQQLSEESDTAINAFTDLSIYHPGDTVKWVAVAYSFDVKSHTPLAGAEIKSKILLPNGTEQEADPATTDEFGRATGTLVLPKEGLTGFAYLSLSTTGGGGGVSFMVSDYKLPTYAVEITAVDKNTPADGDVTLRGRAMTYSGVAVGAASVTLDLSVAQAQWWMRTNKLQFYSAEATTDADGYFSFEIPSEVMEAGPAPKGIYDARITVTSQDGESRQASREYTLGPTYILNCNIPSSINAQKPIRLNVSVIDGEGKAVDKRIGWKLTDYASGSIFSGSFSSADPTVDFSNVPSGEYDADFFIESPDSTDRVSSECEVILYRPSDKKAPTDRLLWSPDNDLSVSLDNGRRHSLLYSTSKPEQWILFTLSDIDGRRIIERRWIKTGAGMHRLDISLPSDVDKADLAMRTTFGCVSNNVNVTFRVRRPKEEISIVTETFRDRIVPGSRETWTFRTVDGDSASVRTAMMLNMYNAAIQGIDGIRINPWSLDLRNLYAPFPQEISYSNYGRCSGSIIFREETMAKCRTLDVPEWILYGRGFNSFMTGSPMLMRKAANMASPGVFATDATSMAYGIHSVKESVADVDEVAVAESAQEGAADAGAAMPQQEAVPFAYRDADAASAFFAPTLTTDKDGRLSFTFKVPNANTTWAFGGIAFDNRMSTASISRDIVANKPVMVQPNLPRFLRAGDEAIIKATVINNTDDGLTVATVVEIFDIATGKTVSTEEFTSEIDANSSTTVSSRITAPADAPFIGYRIKSSSEGNADGEQALISILPFTTPVIETKPFYMPTDTTAMSVDLPAMPADARVTLQYCDNPLWYVVTALTGLRASEPSTSVEAASAIYSAAIADGLLRTDKEIAAVLKQWTESDRSDSTLVSMLERNTDLKTVLLSATPWMLDARSDTERMERLALLFDRAQIEDVYSKAVAVLEKNRCDDGGFAWTSQFKESSLWATEDLLSKLGDLNRLGFLPDIKKLQSWINPALEYVQRATLKEWKRYPQGDYTDFVLLTDCWPSFKPSVSGASLIAQTVERTVARWKKYSVNNKAAIVTMLARHGHKSTAQRVLASIREYAVSSPSEGMYWPSTGDVAGGTMWQLGVAACALDAFALLQPGSADIDLIRQWLILQKETRNWGSSAMTSKVITSILCTSSTWIRPAGSFTITVGGQQVALPEIEKTLGYFRTDISAMNPSGKKLHIDKSAASAAWGAVYCQYTDRITSVKAQSCDALSIEKRILKQQGTEWIETADFAVGDRVKVLLTIHANRDLEYIAITDDRAACLEPVEQLPQPVWSEGVCFYRENRNSSSNMFVTRMPKGTYQLSYELWVNNAGSYTSGIATAQSQYAPQITAHSSGSILKTE